MTPTWLSNVSPVTSAAFFSCLGSRYLLVGEDCFAKVFEVTTSRLVYRTRIFARQRIHGIALSASGSHVLFWGGRSVCITPTSKLLSENTEAVTEVTATDWVFAAAFLDTGEVEVAAVTAHNDLLRFSERTGWKEPVEGDRCMLYAAHVLVLPERAGVLIAAGTVFGEILLWSVTADSRTKLHRKLQGHEGSVFGISISPVYAQGTQERRYLASCSDDRTIRIWDASDLDGDMPFEEKEGVQGKATGFGAKAVTEGCVALGWGHQARPWGVRFLPSQDEKSVRLVSFSEDLTARFWEFPRDGASRKTVELKTTDTHLLHSGKNIWCSAFDFEQRLMATGGNDGRIGLLDYSGIGTQKHEWSIANVESLLPLEETLTGVQEDSLKEVKKTSKKRRPDAFKSYGIVGQNSIIATTMFGRVVLYRMQEQSWSSLGIWDRLKNWSVVDSWTDSSLAVIGAGDGDVGVFDVDRGTHWWWNGHLGIGKISGVFAVEKDGEIFSFLTTSAASSVMAWHSFQFPATESQQIQPSTILLQSPDSKFVVTSCHFVRSLGKLFVGSRAGDLALYSIETQSTAPVSSPPMAATSYYPEIYPGDAITYISTRPSSTPGETHLETTARTGSYTLHALDAVLTKLHVSKPTTLQNIEGAYHDPNSGHLHLYGFHGKRFVVYDDSTAAEAFSLECGGAHRSWAFRPPCPGTSGNGTFVWTQQTNLNIAHSVSKLHTVLQPGLHGREIKTVAAAPCGRLVATGAEDTTIRISKILDSGDVQGLVCFKRHTTGVLHLEWSTDGEYLFSSGGVEEFFVWRVRRLGSSVGVVEEARCPVLSGEAEVRICGFDVQQQGQDFVIATASSDSAIKVWQYSTETKEFHILHEGRYKESCLFHCKLLRLNDPEQVLLFVAGTDGFVTAYTLPQIPSQDTSFPAPTWTQRIHQSSIKSICFVPEHENRSVKIITGGDDCALGITEVEITADGMLTQDCAVLPRAHASALTAVLYDQKEGRVVSAGMDQKVRVWEVVGRNLRRAGEADSGVADLGDACLIDRKVLVAGLGVEVWEL